MRLKGKVALITGGGSGMGRAASLLFAREGAKVAAIDVTEASAAETARMIKAAGGEAISLRADVSDSEDARAMVEETVRAFGGLDVLYNNAGIEGESGFIAQLSRRGLRPRDRHQPARRMARHEVRTAANRRARRRRRSSTLRRSRESSE